MKKRIIIMLSALSMLFSAASYSEDLSFENYLTGFDYQAREDMKTVVVYYFHRTVRCSTCEMIEKLTVAAVEAGFAAELKSGMVRLEVLNIENEPNLHFETKYRLKSQSVIVSERFGASEKRWKNLDKIWEYVDDASLFVEYIQNGVSEYLHDAG